VWIEKFVSWLAKDIAEIEETLRQPMPQNIHDALEQELGRLKLMIGIASGTAPVKEKNKLSALRANLRWGRIRLKQATPAEKKDLQKTVDEIEREIRVLGEERKRKKLMAKGKATHV
jgi:hypothetical protein